MKKVLSFVLVLALVLGSFSMAFATEVQADVKGQTCENAVKALEDLGVVAGYPDGTFKPENTVTRAEAAKMVIAALGLTAQAEGNSCTFADCQGHWAAGYIGYAQALGVLKGRTATTFDPNGNVSYQELLTMLVRAIGYTDASLPGTWPANYVTKAKGLGLLKDVEKAGNAAAVRGDVAIMLFNSLEKQLGYINNDNQWVGYKTTVGDYEVEETMLSRLDKLGATAELVLTDKGGYYLTTTGSITYASGVDLSNYYGAYAKVYLNDQSEITGIKEVKSTFVTVDVATDVAISASTTEITNDDLKYTNKISNAKYALFANDRLVVDGITSTGLSLDTSKISDYDSLVMAVKLDGKTIKEVYSINALNPDKTILWDDTYAARVAKKNQLSSTAKFSEDKNGDIDASSFTLVGAKDLASIANDSIVTYYLSGTEITRVEVSTATVTGKVTKVKDNTKFTINGTTYKLAAISGECGDLELGAEGTAYLAYNGKIAKFEGKSEPDNYAMIVEDGTITAASGYDTGTVQVKLYTAEGVKKVFNLEDDAKVVDPTAPAVEYKAEDITPAQLDDYLPAGHVVTYKLNKDGNITKIAAVDSTANASANGKKFANNGYLGGKELASNVVVFTGTAPDFELGSLKDLETGDDLSATYFVMDKDNKKIAAVWTNESNLGTIGLITGYGMVKDADDDDTYELTVLVNGKEETFLTKDDNVANYNTKPNTLVELKIKSGKVDTITPTNAAASMNATKGSITPGGIGKGTIDLGTGYLQVNNAVVYKIAFNNKGEFDEMVVVDVKDLSADDYVIMYDYDDDNDGYDIIILIEEDDYTHGRHTDAVTAGDIDTIW